MDAVSPDPSPTADQRPVVPSWLHRLAAIGWRVLVTVALGVVVLLVLARLSTVTVSILVALIMTATFAPYAASLRARGWSRLKAAGVVTLGAIALMVVAVILLLVALVPSLVDLARLAQEGVTTFGAWLASAGLSAEVTESIHRAVEQVETWLAGQVASLVGGIATVATVATLGGFLTFYMLKDGDKAWDIGLSEVRDWRRERMTATGQAAMERAGRWVRGTAVIAAVDAIVMVVALAVLGVPFPGPLGVLIFLFGFVPYLGPLVSTSVVVLVAAASGGIPVALAILAIAVILKLIERRFLGPYVYGRTANVHPAVILVALLAGAALGGVVGMVIAVPTVAVLFSVTGTLIEVLGEGRVHRPPVDGDIPAWLDRLGQWSWRLLVGAALVGLGIAIAGSFPAVVGPIVVAVTLAATFLPAVKALEARGWGRGRAALVVSIALWAVVIVVTIASLLALAGPARQAIEAAVTGSDKIDTALPDGASGAAHELAAAIGSGIVGTITSAVAGMAGFVLFLVLSALLSFYMLMDGGTAWSRVTSHIRGWRRAEIEATGTTSVRMLGGYMFATGVLGLFNAVTGWAVMVLLGLPLALPVAILSFFGGFIPYIGQAVTSLIGFLVAVAFGSTQDILIMAIWTVIFNLVQGSFIAPLVYGRAVSLHPAVVLVAIPAGGQLAGILGMFLAVPVLGIVAAVWRHVLTAIGDKPPAPVTEPAATADPVAPAAAVDPAGT